MSEKLRQLPGAQKKAIVALACIVEAQGKGGHFKSIDPEVDTIIEECFDNDWAGNWDDEYRHLYLAGAVLLDKDQCIETVSALDMETKQAFKNLLLDIVGDDAMTVLAAAYVLKGIGMPSTPIPSAPTPRKNDKNTQEEDGTYVVEDSYFARLSDVNAVRSDDVKVFTIVDEDDDTQVKVGCGFNAWSSTGVCPANGIIGYVRNDRTVDTPEGKLCYLICEDYLVVPVLEWGLERIDEWEYRSKTQYNKVLSYDKSGKRCASLRSMKQTAPTFKGGIKEADSDKKVVHFMATVQERFEPGRFFEPNYIQRQIHLTYTSHGSRLKLEVMGVMKPRNAKFESDDGRILKYRDEYNPSVYYEVETEPVHNSIVRVSIFQLNQVLEYVEFRYTIDEYNG